MPLHTLTSGSPGNDGATDGQVIVESDAYVVQVPADDPLILQVVEPITVDPMAVTGGTYLLRDELGAPLGVASLDADGIVERDQLPPALAPILSYLHDQTSPSTVWLITHPLTFQPAAIEVVEYQGTQHYPQVSYPSAQTVQLRFRREVRGTARLS